MISHRRVLHLICRIGLLAIAALLHAGSAAAGSSRCTLLPSPGEAQEVVCAVDSSPHDSPLRFVVDFGGSHDDTRLTIDATLDGEPVACDARSKTNSRFEDGPISLDCGFVAMHTDPQAERTLRVALFVHHAQYVDSRLVAE